MNFSYPMGWHYNSASDRSPSWAGVNQLYAFLTNNIVINRIGEGYGPFAEEQAIEKLDVGDLIFLSNQPSLYYHAIIVVGFKGNIPLVASHSFDAFDKPLNSYNYLSATGLHVLGVRK